MSRQGVAAIVLVRIITDDPTIRSRDAVDSALRLYSHVGRVNNRPVAIWSRVHRFWPGWQTHSPAERSRSAKAERQRAAQSENAGLSGGVSSHHEILLNLH